MFPEIAVFEMAFCHEIAILVACRAEPEADVILPVDMMRMTTVNAVSESLRVGEHNFHVVFCEVAAVLLGSFVLFLCDFSRVCIEHMNHRSSTLNTSAKL